jgi:hypothetical protein
MSPNPTKCEWQVPSTRTSPRHRWTSLVEWVRPRTGTDLGMRYCTAHREEWFSNFNAEFRLKEEPLWEKV